MTKPFYTLPAAMPGFALGTAYTTREFKHRAGMVPSRVVVKSLRWVLGQPDPIYYGSGANLLDRSKPLPDGYRSKLTGDGLPPDRTLSPERLTRSDVVQFFKNHMPEAIMPGAIVQLQRGWTDMLVREVIVTERCEVFVYATYHMDDVLDPDDSDPLQCEWNSQVCRGDIGNVGGGYVRLATEFRRIHKAEDVLFEIKTTEGDTDMATEKKLYEWKQDVDGKTVDFFGHHIATNSEGKWVMEVKGTGGTIVVVDAKDVNRVMPYTVAVRFTEQRGGMDAYHYLTVKGAVKEGDLLIIDTDSHGSSFARVTKVNTQSDKATKWLRGTVVQGTPLPGEDAEAATE